jgi:hypothetical protein
LRAPPGEPSFQYVSNTLRYKGMRGSAVVDPDTAGAWAALDGRHPYRTAVEGGHVDYRARRRRDGEVAFFNFALAREMGLIPRRHSDAMTPALRKRILDTFAIVIVNEYDLAHGSRFRRKDMLPGHYMATRYLQLQHPDRRGTTSGDGRSVWNGIVKGPDATWDVSSCGTGVTRLCPATAATRRFFKTGSRRASYGCGTASIEEGLAAALMSETFHRNGIPTERSLAVLALPGGFAINVRAARSLLRPSHLFAPLKQNDIARLRAAVDYAAGREGENGERPQAPSGPHAYRAFAERTARAFGRAAATFEREYVFCWMEWDGDNILLDGGIIDYGSVRQFGLFHREYRYDDGPRWSTTILEQKRKAREIVKCLAQAHDAVIRGVRLPLTAFRRDPLLGVFDRSFSETRDELLLQHMGFGPDEVAVLRRKAVPLVRRFDRAHSWFERARSACGPVEVPDGISWNAVYSTRDLLRELPRVYSREPRPIPARVLLALAASSYAGPAERRATPSRARRCREFQLAYLALVRRAARCTGRSVREVLTGLARRSARVNAYARVTGDAVAHAAARLARARKRLGADGVYQVVDRFAGFQTRRPDTAGSVTPPDSPDAKRVFDDLLRLVIETRDGL